jgi:ABC-type phosphate/phosphonate transport system substrate-binding protein
MTRHVPAVLLPLFAVLLSPAAASARGATREIVICSEELVLSGKSLHANVEGFVRRLERVAGWPKGSLVGKGFSRPAEAYEYLRAGRASFAILPVSQYARGRTALKLDVLGRAVGLDGTEPGYFALARRGPRDYQNLIDRPGLRLATPHVTEPRWLAAVFDGNVRPTQHFRLIPVADQAAAVDAVLAMKADAALVFHDLFRRLGGPENLRGDFEVVFVSPPIPPPPIVAVGKRASRADRKVVTEALKTLCKGEGAEACGRVGIVYVESGHAGDYEAIAAKHDTYTP